jgi:hypothetical protein
MAVLIPENRQHPGWLTGSPWIVLQAWPIADLWTIALLGPEGGRIVEGYGNWETIPIPRGKPITEWTGIRPYTISLDLLYTGWYGDPVIPRQQNAFIGYPNVPWGGVGRFSGGPGEWIEWHLDGLQRLATRQPTAGSPYSVRTWGAIHYPASRWVIQSLEWGDQIRDKNTGRRLRQQVTVQMIEYNQPLDIQKLPRGNASG